MDWTEIEAGGVQGKDCEDWGAVDSGFEFQGWGCGGWVYLLVLEDSTG